MCACNHFVPSQVKFWDFNAMDASRRAFRTLQPFECHQIKSIDYSITGDTVLIAAGNAQVYALLFFINNKAMI